jgi:hypothetical protein
MTPDRFVEQGATNTRLVLELVRAARAVVLADKETYLQLSDAIFELKEKLKPFEGLP